MTAETAAPTRSEVYRRLETEVGTLLARVKRAVAERARELDTDLAPSAYVVADYISNHGPVRAVDLVSLFNLDKGAVSRHLKHLVELGFVETQPDPHDGRATLLKATPLLRRRLTSQRERRVDDFAERLSTWSVDDLTNLVDVLGRYNETLE